LRRTLIEKRAHVSFARTLSHAPIARSSSPRNGCVVDSPPFNLATCNTPLSLAEVARVSAVVSLKVEDYFPLQKRWWLRLKEKRGKVNEMGCHHKLEQYLDEYITAAGIAEDKKGPLSFEIPGASR
jgi:hypothetical protein